MFIIAAFAALLAGCWRSTETRSIPASEVLKPSVRFPESLVGSLLIKGAGKTAVFSVEEKTEEENRKVEANVSQIMKEQGFDALPGRTQIPSAGQYSAADLEKILRKEGFQSIAKVVYTLDAEGREHLSFELHGIPDERNAGYPGLVTTLDFAIITFVNTAIQFGLSKI